MLQLNGYQTTELLHRGGRFSVYRGHRRADGHAVVIKTHTKAYPSLQEIAKLKQEYKLASALTMSGVPKCVGLERYGDSRALVAEDAGARSLDLIQRGGPMEMAAFIPLAIQLASILDNVHRSGIIHKDIKPGHILVSDRYANGERSGEHTVMLIDFGIAAMLSSERQAIVPSNAIEGTLAYMSPEQTGRIKRTIDQRSDLYSLGVTFYELLTGGLPFPSKDPLELLHCHVAKIPRPPHERNVAVPAPLSAMVMKLLAKTPEERYRSAEGLRRDLERYQNATALGQEISLHDALGQEAEPDVFHIPQKLYGRAAEVAQLLAMFERTSAGSKEILLVSGHSGIGKSSLVHEIHRPILARRGIFAAGKFDQHKRDVPYASMAQAFSALVKQVLSDSPQRVDKLKTQLRQALGANGQLIIDVIPEVEYLIGPQMAPPRLFGADAQRRFHHTFLQFLRIFAAKDHPLVLFLDDLQWADHGTLTVIELLMKTPDIRHLMLIGAYRDNEVGVSHPLRALLAELRSAGIAPCELVLDSLKNGAVSELLSDTLLCRRDACDSLSQLLWQKTAGNPFFVCQLLDSLHRDGRLLFDAGTRGWTWDMSELRVIPMTDNVVELIARRIGELSEGAQNILKTASCIGNTFDLRTLAAVHGMSLEEIAAALWNPLEQSMIVPRDSGYKIACIWDLADTDNENDSQMMREAAQSSRYKFLHDRVQEAAYSLISHRERPRIHLQIARLWLASTGEAELDDRLFDIVSHYHAAIDLVQDREELYRLVQLDIAAAAKAKATSAFRSALELLDAVMVRLPDDCWRERPELTLSCYIETAEAHILNGYYTAARPLLEHAAEHAAEMHDRCRICELRVFAHMMTNDVHGAFALMADMLAVLGVRFANFPSEDTVRREFEITMALMADKRPEELVDLPDMTAADKIATCRLLRDMWVICYHLGSLAMHIVAMKMVQLSITYGNTGSSAFGYVVYSFAVMFHFEDIDEGYRVGQIGLKLQDRFQNREVETKILDMWGGLMQHYKEHIRHSRETLMQGLVRGMDAGDYLWATYCGVNHGFLCLLGDVPLCEVSEHLETSLAATQEFDENMAKRLRLMREVVASLTEEKADPTRLVGAHCDEDALLAYGAEKGEINTLFFVYTFKTCVAVWFGGSSASDIVRFIDETDRSRATAPGVFPNSAGHFFRAIALLDVHGDLTPEMQSQCMDKVAHSLEKLRHWSEHAPENYTHMAVLLEAELCRTRGESDRAIGLYERAIQCAREHGFTSYQGLACERAARFFRALGSATVERAYMADARQCYLLWGADAKVGQIDAAYPSLAAQTRIDDRVHAPPREDELDLLAIMKASQAISRELVLDQLIETLLGIAVEIAGAERSVLLLCRQDSRQDSQLWIEATKETATHGSISHVLPMALEASADDMLVPKQVVRYAGQSRGTVLLDDARLSGQFSDDGYIQARRVKSVLCVPIILLGKLTGLLYLENNLCVGAFRSAHVKVIELLAMQAAVSLENARLYNEVECRVEERTRELKAAQQELVTSARKAGMAEVASNILHNAGNILNSVGVSVSLLRDRLPRSTSASSARFSQLLKQHEHDLANFFTSPKGQKVPRYIETLTERMEEEDGAFLSEVQELRQRIEHLQRLVTLQQKYAVGSNLIEEVDLAQLVTEVVQHTRAQLDGDGVEVRWRPACAQPVLTDRHKVREILRSLIDNALLAIRHSGDGTGHIVLQTKLPNDDGRIGIEVTGSGIGILPENLDRIFQQDFSTWGDEQGLGLHASANAARELGGQLTAISEADGKATTLRLELPNLTPDVTTINVTTMDVATPDVATPDVTTPDVTTIDVATPDATTMANPADGCGIDIA